jgi:hypothetical protein
MRPPTKCDPIYPFAGRAAHGRRPACAEILRRWLGARAVRQTWMPTFPMRVRSLLGLSASLLSIALSGQRLLDTKFLARLQVKGVSLDFPDYVLLQDLPLEALEGILKRLAVLEPHLSQIAPPALTRIPICRSAFATEPDFGIIGLSPTATAFSINCCFIIQSEFTCFSIPKACQREASLWRTKAKQLRVASHADVPCPPRDLRYVPISLAILPAVQPPAAAGTSAVPAASAVSRSAS